MFPDALAGVVDQIPSSPSVICDTSGGSYTGNEASNSPITIWMPFENGQIWQVGNVGSFYGNYMHCNANNDYYATDWTRVNGSTQGAKVLPIADGQISDYDSPPCPTTGYGCYVQVDHANGTVRTLYAHLQSVYQTSGSVNHWEPIGEVGGSGSAGGAFHLHLTFKSKSSGIYYSHCNKSGGCDNGEDAQSPQSSRPSPMKTAGGNVQLVDGGVYTSNNEAPATTPTATVPAATSTPRPTSTPLPCSAPALLSPIDGYLSPGQDIDFSWESVTGCNFSGYDFRIKDTSNMEVGGTLIVDDWVNTTSTNVSIAPAWNDQDLYWSVRAANAYHAEWAVAHRFRVPTRCVAPALLFPPHEYRWPQPTIRFSWQPLTDCLFSEYEFCYFAGGPPPGDILSNSVDCPGISIPSSDPWVSVTIPEAAYDMPLFWWVRARAASPDDLDGNWSPAWQFMIDTSIRLVFLPAIFNGDSGTQAPSYVDPYPGPESEAAAPLAPTPNPYP